MNPPENKWNAFWAEMARREAIIDRAIVARKIALVVLSFLLFVVIVTSVEVRPL